MVRYAGYLAHVDPSSLVRCRPPPRAVARGSPLLHGRGGSNVTGLVDHYADAVFSEPVAAGGWLPTLPAAVARRALPRTG